MDSEIIEQDAIKRLAAIGIVPLVGGLIPERGAAMLTGYSATYFRRQAAIGNSKFPFIMRGNRRFYKLADFVAFVSERDGK